MWVCAPVIDDYIERSSFRRDFGQELLIGLIADEYAHVVLLMLAARWLDIYASNLGFRVLPPPILETAAVTNPNLEQRLDGKTPKLFAIGRQIMCKLLKMLHLLWGYLKHWQTETASHLLSFRSIVSPGR